MRFWIGITQLGLALIAFGCVAWGVSALRDKEAECARTMQRTPLIRAAEHAFAFAAVGLVIVTSAFVIMTIVLVTSP